MGHQDNRAARRSCSDHMSKGRALRTLQQSFTDSERAYPLTRARRAAASSRTESSEERG